MRESFRLPAMMGMRNPFEIHLAGGGSASARIAVELRRWGSGKWSDPGFRGVGVGESKELTFTLRNQGSGTLSRWNTAVVVSGPDTADFQVTVQPGRRFRESTTAIGLANGSFELPGAWGGRMGLPPEWLRLGFGTKSGLAGNGSPWFVNATPSGGQAAFVQSTPTDRGRERRSRRTSPLVQPVSTRFASGWCGGVMDSREPIWR